VDAQVREILAVIKQTTQKFDVESFNLRKLNELELRKIIRLRSQRGLQL